MSNKIVNVLPNELAVIEDLCQLVEKSANEAIKKDDVFKVGLSGLYLLAWALSGLCFLEYCNALDFDSC